MIKTKMIGVMLMASSVSGKDHQDENGEEDTQQWTRDGEPEGDVPCLSLQTHRARDCELILSWKASTPPVLAMAHFVLFDPRANCL